MASSAGGGRGCEAPASSGSSSSELGVTGTVLALEAGSGWELGWGMEGFRGFSFSVYAGRISEAAEKWLRMLRRRNWGRKVSGVVVGAAGVWEGWLLLLRTTPSIDP